MQYWETARLEDHHLRNGFLADVRAVQTALSSSLPKLPRSRVVCGIPGFQSFLQIMELPKASGGKLDAIVQREGRRFLPNTQDNLQVFWQAYGPKRSSVRSIYLVAVPRQPLLIFWEGLRAAGLKPRRMDLRPLALARAVNAQDAIIGHSAGNCVEVVIVRADVPVVIRSLFLGDGFLPLEVTGSRLADELIRTISHYNNTSKQGPLPPDLPVHLTGSGAWNPELPAMVRETTERPIASLSPPFDCPPNFPAAQYMANLGLILKDL